MDLAWNTPLWESPWLADVCGRPVWLKMEALQPVGSFKIRGISRFCASALAASREAKPSLVCASGGNAGLAVAYAARRFEVPASIFVPVTTPEPARAALRREGADVFEFGDSWDDSQAEAQSFADRNGGIVVHPFDHPELWLGHADLIAEAREQGPKPGQIVCSVGGGGLLCGVLDGLERVGWTDVSVVAVETEGAASLAASLEAGERVQLDRIDSLATTLGARRVASGAFERAQRFRVQSELVSDREAVGAAAEFAEFHRVLVEPACGAAIAAAKKLNDSPETPLLVVVCGGAGVTPQLLQQWQEAVRTE